MTDAETIAIAIANDPVAQQVFELSIAVQRRLDLICQQATETLAALSNGATTSHA